MATPLFLREPSLLLCGAFALIFLLRYPITENRRDLRIFLVAALSLAGAVLCNRIAEWEGILISKRYDLYVYRADEWLGGEPGVRLGHLFLAHVWRVRAIDFVYGLLPAAVMFLLFAYEPLRDFRVVLTAILLNVCLAPLLYALIPVSGPRFAFAGFPEIPAIIVPHPIYLHDAPNGIPSIHLSTAALIWWYARRWRLGGAISYLFLALTMIATLASGQHYLLDLLVAVPYCILIALMARAQVTQTNC